MTATIAEPTAAPDLRAPGRPILFGRAVAFEWTKLVGVRATWVNGVLALLGTIGLGMLFGASVRYSGENGFVDVTPATSLAFQSVVVGQALVMAIMTLFVTSEYATGSIRTTLQAVPRRGRLLSAKVAVAAGVGAVAGLVLTPLASVAAALLGRNWVPLGTAGDLAVATLGTMAFFALLGVLVVGLALALRSTAGSLVTLFVLMYVVPQVLPAFGVEWLTKAADYLPFSAFAVLGLGSGPYERPVALLVMGVWALLALVIGGVLLRRRDSQ